MCQISDDSFPILHTFQISSSKSRRKAPPNKAADSDRTATSARAVVREISSELCEVHVTDSYRIQGNGPVCSRVPAHASALSTRTARFIKDISKQFVKFSQMKKRKIPRRDKSPRNPALKGIENKITCHDDEHLTLHSANKGYRALFTESLQKGMTCKQPTENVEEEEEKEKQNLKTQKQIAKQENPRKNRAAWPHWHSAESARRPAEAHPDTCGKRGSGALGGILRSAGVGAVAGPFELSSAVFLLCSLSHIRFAFPLPQSLSSFDFSHSLFQSLFLSFPVQSLVPLTSHSMCRYQCNLISSLGFTFCFIGLILVSEIPHSLFRCFFLSSLFPLCCFCLVSRNLSRSASIPFSLYSSLSPSPPPPFSLSYSLFLLTFTICLILQLSLVCLSSSFFLTYLLFLSLLYLPIPSLDPPFCALSLNTCSATF